MHRRVSNSFETWFSCKQSVTLEVMLDLQRNERIHRRKIDITFVELIHKAHQPSQIAASILD
jgi:hypothetical protein